MSGLLLQPAVESIGVDSMRRLVHGGFRQDKIIAGQENRAVIAWCGTASTGLVSSADRAYLKASVPGPALRLVDKVSRSGGHTSGKVAGQRATVKAEMGGKPF